MFAVSLVRSFPPALGAGKLGWAVPSYHVIQPAAYPNDSSRKRRGNSMIGPLTGNSAVISPRHATQDQSTVPPRMKAMVPSPGPAKWMTLPA